VLHFKLIVPLCQAKQQTAHNASTRQMHNAFTFFRQIYSQSQPDTTSIYTASTAALRCTTAARVARTHTRTHVGHREVN